MEEHVPSALPAGTILKNSYQIIKVLGLGGFGITYLVKHDKLKKLLVIKELFPTGSGRVLVRRDDQDRITVRAVSSSAAAHFEKMRSKFLEEALCLTQIDGERNPEVIKVYDFFETNATAYIVMPYLEGCTLADLVIEEGVVSEILALRVLRTMLRALRVVHRANLLHQDVKPENIYLVDRQQPVLIDFGNARSVEPNIKTGLQAGTPGYAPPEQRSGTMNQSGDIYALGATLYAVLTGQTPPPAEDRLNGIPLTPSTASLKSHISIHLIEFLDKAMKLRVEERFSNVDEVFFLLKPLLEPRLDWISQIPDVALRSHMSAIETLVNIGGKTYPLHWNWRPAFLSYIWFFSLRVAPVGYATVLIESFCVALFFFAEYLSWLWLIPPLLTRIGLGLTGDWLVYQDLFRHIQRVKEVNGSKSPHVIHQLLRARLRPHPSMWFIAFGLGPLMNLVAALLADSQRDNIREQVSAGIQVNGLMCAIQNHIKAHGFSPSKEKINMLVIEPGPQIDNYELEDAHLILTLSSPSSVRNKKVRLEFDPASGRHLYCRNIDIPDVYLPSRCLSGNKIEPPQCD